MDAYERVMNAYENTKPSSDGSGTIRRRVLFVVELRNVVGAVEHILDPEMQILAKLYNVGLCLSSVQANISTIAVVDREFAFACPTLDTQHAFWNGVVVVPLVPDLPSPS